MTYAQKTDTAGAVHSATYVADWSNNGTIYVEHRRERGRPPATIRIYGGNLLQQPTDMIMLPSGNLLIADTGNGDLVEINTSTCDPATWTGAPNNCQASIVASGFARPAGLAYDTATGNLYVSDFELNAIFQLTGF